MVSLSVIIPTIGRESLRRSLESVVLAGAGRQDEVLVFADGPRPRARAIAESFHGKLRILYHETDPTGGWGGPQRNVAMACASGSHLAFIDDDDAYRPGALEIVRRAATEKPSSLFLFRMENHAPRRGWGIKWDSKTFCWGNVSTDMIYIPNAPERLGKWTKTNCNDFDFLSDTLSRPGWPPVEWREEILVDLY